MNTADSPSFPSARRRGAHFHRRGQSAFTLMEVIIFLMILAVLAILAVPVFMKVNAKGEQVKALSNAKQIALAMRLYASDNDGAFPSFTLHNGKPTATVVPDSNTAFAQLFPDYIQEEAIFWLKNSAFCSPNPPDEVTDKTALDTPVETLKKGENEWAYVVRLNDTSNSDVPLLADGFADPAQHTYTADPTRPGGVWKGQVAIVVHCDTSGEVMKVDPATMTVTGPNTSRGKAGPAGDIFTTANSASGWLNPANTVANPK